MGNSPSKLSLKFPCLLACLLVPNVSHSLFYKTFQGCFLGSGVHTIACTGLILKPRCFMKHIHKTNYSLWQESRDLRVLSSCSTHFPEILLETIIKLSVELYNCQIQRNSTQDTVHSPSLPGPCCIVVSTWHTIIFTSIIFRHLSQIILQLRTANWRELKAALCVPLDGIYVLL